MSKPDARVEAILVSTLDLAARTLRAYGVEEADLDDALQQVCMVVAQKAPHIAVGAERAFVFRTSHRMAHRFRRTRQRRREVREEEAEGQTITHLDPESIADERQALDILARLLDSMEDDLKEVFVLFELEELTTSQIAGMLEIPEGTVASRLRRARALFRAKAEKLRLKARVA
jgi:RNA polymerase sigma-70 factor (ECF subfamily)